MSSRSSYSDYKDYADDTLVDETYTPEKHVWFGKDASQYLQSRLPPGLQSRLPAWSWLQWSIAGACAVFVCLLLSFQLNEYTPSSHLGRMSATGSSELTYNSHPDVPAGVKVVGLVFYGRPAYVDILDCFFRRNLKTNGGILDEIRFVLHTPEQDAIRWLEDLVERDGLQDDYKLLYEKKDISGVWASKDGDFSYLWGRYATDDDTIYIKIDDDLVWIDDNAIPNMVDTLLKHPEAFSVNANTVNSRFTHWYHYGTGAILPFLPDKKGAASYTPENLTDWRTSKLPPYPIKSLPKFSGDDQAQEHSDPPSEYHRWLPLPDNPVMLSYTSFAFPQTLPDPVTGDHPSHPTWMHAAQEHMSLFNHIEHETLDSYRFGRPDGLWSTGYQHYSINFMAFWGSTVAKRPFWDKSNAKTYNSNDEYSLTMYVPEALKMPVYVDTRAVVAHFAFHSMGQRAGLEQTDILDRFRLLANDRYCAASNQKTPDTAVLCPDCWCEDCHD